MNITQAPDPVDANPYTDDAHHVLTATLGKYYQITDVPEKDIPLVRAAFKTAVQTYNLTAPDSNRIKIRFRKIDGIHCFKTDLDVSTI